MNGKNPLFLPKGSVRSILAIAFSAAFIWTAVATGSVPGDLGVLTSAIIAFYFGTRSPAS